MVTINTNVSAQAPNAAQVRQGFLQAVSRTFAYSNLRNILLYGINKPAYQGDKDLSNAEIGLAPDLYSAIGCVEVGPHQHRIHMHATIKFRHRSNVAMDITGVRNQLAPYASHMHVRLLNGGEFWNWYVQKGQPWAPAMPPFKPVTLGDLQAHVRSRYGYEPKIVGECFQA